MQAGPTLPAIDYGQRSDPGRDPQKQNNEDACGHAETALGHLCVVCDGMGGHAGGREAAELALATILESFEQCAPDAPPAAALRAAIEEANRRVHVMRTSEIGFGRPGSTVVAILVHAHGTEVAHVGDSRVYLVHQGRVSRLTRDHSIVQELVDRGLITMEQAAHHPDANRITRALGMLPDVEVELRSQPVAHVSGDAFLLCSDGLCDLVEDHEILSLVAGDPPEQAVGKLVDLANARGGHDNITAIVVRARESAGAAPIAGGAFVVGPTVVQTGVTDPQALLDDDSVPPAPPAPSGPPRTLLQEPVTPALHPGGAVLPGLPASGPIAQATNASGPIAQATNASGPIAQATNASGPIAQATNASGPMTQPMHTSGPPFPASFAPRLPEPRPLAPTPPPPTTMGPEGRPGPVVIVALLLAAAAFVLLAFVLLGHFSELRGKSNGPAATPVGLVPAAAPSGSARALVPETVTLAPAIAPNAEPIAPLEPSPDAPPRKHRKRDPSP